MNLTLYNYLGKKLYTYNEEVNPIYLFLSDVNISYNWG